MSMDWYNSIAVRNGGYRNDAVFTVEGISAEKYFERELADMLPNTQVALDAGCGHGDFTLRIASYANSLIGFDNAVEMIKIAERSLQASGITNVQFLYATTKTELPFSDEQFDLVYSRRGPTSIINHSRILRSGGIIFGIHSGALEVVKERLENNFFEDVAITEYSGSKFCFPNETEFAKFLAGIPGNPNYMLPEYRSQLDQKMAECAVEGRLELPEYKYIWKARKT